MVLQNAAMLASPQFINYLIFVTFTYHLASNSSPYAPFIHQLIYKQNHAVPIDEQLFMISISSVDYQKRLYFDSLVHSDIHRHLWSAEQLAAVFSFNILLCYFESCIQSSKFQSSVFLYFRVYTMHTGDLLLQSYNRVIPENIVTDIYTQLQKYKLDVYVQRQLSLCTQRLFLNHLAYSDTYLHLSADTRVPSQILSYGAQNQHFVCTSDTKLESKLKYTFSLLSFDELQ
ncbi:Hypothetical_protein [Hexamita inflata]|uniref:Hypothetical_protein n=1 Tax=Hexamita inflata TaxID=28002 RepID=A0AA86NT14_9EUKA|nr:Hypothetical protein HINF_LOCUS13617 [Hexamita inflata]CAI9925996.1 Hypothetical protein HINF_LOCUS13641 [Hexamita inflata]CAI9933917.1 Hypothetical protein HINF_LOCUS21562 [Hexamita inflata]